MVAVVWMVGESGRPLAGGGGEVGWAGKAASRSDEMLPLMTSKHAGRKRGPRRAFLVLVPDRLDAQDYTERLFSFPHSSLMCVLWLTAFFLPTYFLSLLPPCHFFPLFFISFSPVTTLPAGSFEKGRKISKAAAVAHPTTPDAFEAARGLGVFLGLEGKCHPRHFPTAAAYGCICGVRGSH